MSEEYAEWDREAQQNLVLYAHFDDDQEPNRSQVRIRRLYAEISRLRTALCSLQPSVIRNLRADLRDEIMSIAGEEYRQILEDDGYE